MNINYDLVIRFAQWLMGVSEDKHGAGQLLAAARNKSQMVGRRIEFCLKHSGVTKDQLTQAFNEDELLELFDIPVKYDPNYDYTKRNRTKKRQQILNAKAHDLGFDGLSQMLTRWKNGEIELVVK